MITKTPDYLISECGYPELWNSDSKHTSLTQINNKFWNSYTLWCSNKSSKLSTKLLPLRESWTDYYTKNLLKENEESMKYSKLTLNRRQQKNPQQQNEIILNKKRSFHFHSSKRYGDAKDSSGVNGLVLMNSKQRSRTKNLDNDVDQF
ncbi:uncharacterized protein LOC142223350 [Haematobia irritans]|uniref:uncharacterized protein LOC142223350 n=1 Tax=Haematobia irritans TaxID=7368 RepID=UPI003F507A8B